MKFLILIYNITKHIVVYKFYKCVLIIFVIFNIFILLYIFVYNFFFNRMLFDKINGKKKLKYIKYIK